MWKRVDIGGSEFLMKHNISGTLHKVCVTNMIQLWFEEILEETLLCRCKEMNKLVEASDEVFLNNVWFLVESEGCDIVRDFSPNETGKILTLQTTLEGFKFKVKFLLAPANSNQFYEDITQPLLTTVCELTKRHQLLVDLIKTKDMEIEEYKLEGGQISRKAVQTEPFDLEAFSVKCQENISASKSSVAVTPTSAFTAPVQDLLKKIVAAPLIASEEIKGSSRQPKSKKLILTVKSPEKSKRQKIYDDEDEDTADNLLAYKDDKMEKEELKVKQETKPRSPTKARQNIRLQRALNNL